MVPTNHDWTHQPVDSISNLFWLPDCALEGEEQIPVLGRSSRFEFPNEIVAFDRIGSLTAERSTLLHFFVADSVLYRLLRQPFHYVPKLAKYETVATPDFSLYRSMPPHRRILSTALNRSFGVLFQSRGIDVIPTIRWSGPEDYKFAFAGVAPNSPIAVSNHGCWRSKEDKKTFEQGLIAAVESLQPSAVLLHGRLPRTWVLDELERQRVPFRTYPSRIESIHNLAGPRGRR